MPWTIRVKAKTSPDWRVISVADDGHQVTCDCAGFRAGFCSHIDAVLVANERGMVHPDDHEAADHAHAKAGGLIEVPANWQGAWRRELWWRGIKRRPSISNPRDSGRPLVCFTGALPGKSRREWIAEAKAAGWDTTDEPSRFTDVLVTADPQKLSAKLKLARVYNTPVVSPEDWSIVMLDGALP